MDSENKFWSATSVDKRLSAESQIDNQPPSAALNWALVKPVGSQ